MPKHRLSGAEANFRQYLLVTKRSAKRRRLPFLLSSERFRALTQSPCYFCGHLPSREYRHSLKIEQYSDPYVCHGIDRFDNTKGYVEGNCIPCCWICNRAKGSLTVEQFLLYAYELYQHTIAPALTRRKGTKNEPNE